MANTIKIKETESPTAGTHWSYGPDRMRGISRASAKVLCGMYPLPTIGREAVVAIAPDGFGGNVRLMVKNISGTFFLACTSVQVAYWPQIFQVEIIGKDGKPENSRLQHA